MGAVQFTFGVAAVFGAVLAVVVLLPRQQIPEHLLGHPFVELPNFLSHETMTELMEVTKAAPIPSAAREYDSYKPLRDHIGEGVPFNKTSGKCPEGLFLIPNADKSMCVFPGRIDVGQHYVRTGGPEGMKEQYTTLASRAYSFLRFLFNYNEYPVAKRLLESPDFVKLATAVCPVEKQVLDPIQLNFVCAFPGQTVATHIDAPYFQRASRFHFPQWLLATMVFSGLFRSEFIDQVQVVGYYHMWNDTKGKNGNFLIWGSNDEKPKISQPLSGSANAVDGSKTIHAAEVYMKDHKPPHIAMNSLVEARWNEAKKEWGIFSDGKETSSYPEDQVRFSVVYRARCFRDEAERLKYHEDQKNPMSLEEIYSVFEKDLEKRGLWKKSDNLTPYDWGLLLLKTYVRYPLSPTALVPYNWCALDRLYPSLAPLVKLLC